MFSYELKLQDGKTVVWDGKDGIDACQRYADSHPGSVVVAWRNYRQHGIFPFTAPIVEPKVQV